MAKTPSINRLESYFPGKGAELRAILDGTKEPTDYPAVEKWVAQCLHRPKFLELQLAAVNALLEGHGVEAIQKDGTYGTPEAQYINMGDQYIPTVIWDDGRTSWFIESWDEWMAKAKRRGLTFDGDEE